METRLLENPSTDFICTFLNKHYVSTDTDTGGLKLHYTKEHISVWMKTPYNCKSYFMVLKKDDKPIGIIGCKLIDVVYNETEFKTAEINFLCIHSRFRQHGYHKLLIQKITDFCKKSGADGAIFTGKENLPFSLLSETSYHHLNLSYYRDTDRGVFGKLFKTFSVRKINKHNHRLLVEINKNYESFKEKEFKVFIKNDWSPSFLESSLVYTYGIYDKDNLVGTFCMYRLNSMTKYNQSLNRLYLHSYFLKSGYDSDIDKMLRELFKVLSKEFPRTEVLLLNQMKHSDEKMLRSLGFIKGTGKLNYYIDQLPIYYLESKDVGFFLT
jgi:hypothetical protein